MGIPRALEAHERKQTQINMHMLQIVYNLSDSYMHTRLMRLYAWSKTPDKHMWVILHKVQM